MDVAAIILAEAESMHINGWFRPCQGGPTLAAPKIPDATRCYAMLRDATRVYGLDRLHYLFKSHAWEKQSPVKSVSIDAMVTPLKP